MDFKDHFSGRADAYARYRPYYPESLFRYLAGQVRHHELAWDCATGNGQAALGLSPWFRRVLATDASARQIAAATAHTVVDYRVAPAEACPAAEQSIDLITVAQALHWFNLDGFYAEVRRVLRPEGLLAVWSYGLLNIAALSSQPLRQFYDDVLQGYWPVERRHVENGYRDLPFPFSHQQSVPEFTMGADWDLEQLLGYLNTWSAVQRLRAERGGDPVAGLAEVLRPLWGEPHTRRRIRWPLQLQLGRNC